MVIETITVFLFGNVMACVKMRRYSTHTLGSLLSNFWMDSKERNGMLGIMIRFRYILYKMLNFSWNTRPVILSIITLGLVILYIVNFILYLLWDYIDELLPLGYIIFLYPYSITDTFANYFKNQPINYFAKISSYWATSFFVTTQHLLHSALLSALDVHGMSPSSADIIWNNLIQGGIQYGGINQEWITGQKLMRYSTFTQHYLPPQSWH